MHEVIEAITTEPCLTFPVLTTDNFALNQNIEGFNAADFNWGTASATSIILSFWVRSSLTGTFGGALSNSAVNRSYPFTYTISAANTWKLKYNPSPRLPASMIAPGDGEKKQRTVPGHSRLPGKTLLPNLI